MPQRPASASSAGSLPGTVRRASSVKTRGQSHSWDIQPCHPRATRRHLPGLHASDLAGLVPAAGGSDADRREGAIPPHAACGRSGLPVHCTSARPEALTEHSCRLGHALWLSAVSDPGTRRRPVMASQLAQPELGRVRPAAAGAAQTGRPLHSGFPRRRDLVTRHDTFGCALPATTGSKLLPLPLPCLRRQSCRHGRATVLFARSRKWVIEHERATHIVDAAVVDLRVTRSWHRRGRGTPKDSALGERHPPSEGCPLDSWAANRLEVLR